MSVKENHGVVNAFTMGVFSDGRALRRFGKDCMDLMFDYLHKRHADLDFREMNAQYDACSSLHRDLRIACFDKLMIKAKKIEFSRINYDLFCRFKRTLGWKRQKGCGHEELQNRFRDDLLHVVFRCNKACVTWNSVVLAIVMTTMFIRHATDGNRSPQCVQAFATGLWAAMHRLNEIVKRNLTAWPCFVTSGCREAPPRQNLACDDVPASRASSPKRETSCTIPNCKCGGRSSRNVSPSPRLRSPSPKRRSPQTQYQDLTFSIEARELAMLVLQRITKLNLMAYSLVTECHAPIVQRHFDVLAAVLKRGKKKLDIDTSCLSRDFFNAYKFCDDSPDLQEAVKDIVYKWLCEKGKCGWVSVISIYMILRDLACEYKSTINCRAAELILNGLHCAFLLREDCLLEDLEGGWKAFAEQC